MTQRFADILNSTIDDLVSEGFEIRTIFASPSAIEQLFVEIGDDAILMDCDTSSDRAWYGAFELSPGESAETLILYCRGEECWFKEVAAPGQAAAAPPPEAEAGAIAS